MFACWQITRSRNKDLLRLLRIRDSTKEILQNCLTKKNSDLHFAFDDRWHCCRRCCFSCWTHHNLYWCCCCCYCLCSRYSWTCSYKWTLKTINTGVLLLLLLWIEFRAQANTNSRHNLITTSNKRYLLAWFPPALFECANGFFHLSYASFRFVSIEIDLLSRVCLNGVRLHCESVSVCARQCVFFQLSKSQRPKWKCHNNIMKTGP